MPRLLSPSGWVAAGLITTHAILAWLGRAPGIIGRDDAKYALLGRALRDFAYREIWRDGAPPHAQYPPGFPATLAAWGTIAGDSFDLLILVNIAASAITLALVYRVIKTYWNPAIALLGLLPLVFNPRLISHAGVLSSEPVFTVFSIAALALLAAVPAARFASAGAGALAIAATLTRSAGVPLVPALTAHFALQRRWRAAIGFAVASLLALGAWFWWTFRYAETVVGETYVGDAAAAARSVRGASSIVTRVISRFASYFTERIPSALPIPTFDWAQWIVAIGLLAMTVAGLYAYWRRWRIAALYLLAKAAMLLLWPWVLTRYLAPILPLLVPCLLIGVAGIVAGFRLPPVWQYRAAALLALLITVTGMKRTAALLGTRANCERDASPPSGSCVPTDDRSLFAAAVFVRDSLPADAEVVVSKPELFYWYAGRPSMPLRSALTLDSLHFPTAVAARGARWILLASVQNTEVAMLPRRLAPECERLAVTRHFPPRTWLLRVRDPGEPADSTGCAAVETYRRLNVNRDFNTDP